MQGAAVNAGLSPLKKGDRVGLLTSGGDAPGMNAALRAAAKVGAGLGLEMLGVEEGYQGLMAGRVRPLDLRRLDEASGRGGTVLGSARSKRFPTAEGLADAQASIVASQLKGLVILGGNGSLTGATTLAGTTCFDGSELRVLGIPASIDNDVGCTAMAIGVDTAMNTIVDACDRIADTASSHRRTFIVEVMGRDCGYLAMAAGIAAAADVVLFREGKKSDEEIIDHVVRAAQAAYGKGERRHLLVIKSEGVQLDAGRLKTEVDARLSGALPGVDTRVTVLGHVVRGGAPSAFDRLLASRLANAAVRAMYDGEDQIMAGWTAPGLATRAPSAYDPHVTLWPLDEVLAETRRMHAADSELMRWRVRALAEMESVLYL